MNRLLLTSALIGMMIPAVASAVTVGSTGTVTVDGAVAARCQFGAGGTALINIPELSDTSTGQLDPSTVNGQQATLNGWCNGAGSSMTVQTDPLLNAGAAPTGFSNRVDYTATATANSQSAARSSTLTGASAGAPVGIFSGSILVALSSSATAGGPTLKLIAGPYAGDVLVTLTPSL